MIAAEPNRKTISRRTTDTLKKTKSASIRVPFIGMDADQVSAVSCVAMGPRDNPCVAVGIADWVIRLTPVPNQAAPK
jgi:hypothetical protein